MAINIKKNKIDNHIDIDIDILYLTWTSTRLAVR